MSPFTLQAASGPDSGFTSSSAAAMQSLKASMRGGGQQLQALTGLRRGMWQKQLVSGYVADRQHGICRFNQGLGSVAEALTKPVGSSTCARHVVSDGEEVRG